ncbi:MAG TPA: hypothetical protein VF292_03075 [Rhodanobacteraceae bacterium]
MCKRRNTHHRYPTGVGGFDARSASHFAKRNASFFGAGDKYNAIETLAVRRRMCKKRSYASKREAKLALREVTAARRQEHDTDPERTIYKCAHCGMYHLSHWPALWTAHKGPGGIAVNAVAHA